MNRSDKGRWWYLACKTLRLREMVLSILAFAISFVWIGHALMQYQTLLKMLQKPAVIQAELQQNLQDDLRLSIQSTEGVEALTVYTEDTAVMQWEDYSGDVPVYYVESDYMRWLASQSDSSQMPFSEAMPYAIISEKALENLTREKKEQLLLSKNDLMQDFTLNEDKTVRLYGLIQNEEMPGVYLSDLWEDVSDDVFVSSGSSEQVEDSENHDNPADDKQADSTDEAGRSTIKLMLAVKNGFAVSSVIKKISMYQIDAKSDVMDAIVQTNEKNLSMLETGSIILVCAICMMLTGERMWRLEHRKWLEDIRRFALQPNSDKKVMRRRRLLMIGLGWMGSFLWQWLSVLYGWL